MWVGLKQQTEKNQNKYCHLLLIWGVCVHACICLCTELWTYGHLHARLSTLPLSCILIVGFYLLLLSHLYSFNNPKAHGIHSGNHSWNRGFWNVATISQEPNQEATGALCFIYTLIFINQPTVKCQKKAYLFLTLMCRC